MVCDSTCNWHFSAERLVNLFGVGATQAEYDPGFCEDDGDDQVVWRKPTWRLAYSPCDLRKVARAPTGLTQSNLHKYTHTTTCFRSFLPRKRVSIRIHRKVIPMSEVGQPILTHLRYLRRTLERRISQGILKWALEREKSNHHEIF